MYQNPYKAWKPVLINIHLAVLSTVIDRHLSKKYGENLKRVLAVVTYANSLMVLRIGSYPLF